MEYGLLRGDAMSMPRLSRRQFAMVAATTAPLVVALICLLALRIRYKLGTRPLDATELLTLYVGVFVSVQTWVQFRRPLIDPAGRGGIFGKREQPRHRLWMTMVSIAAI